MGWGQEYWQSIKAVDAEDRLDLAFYRPLGFLFAKVGAALRMSPTHLTLIGMLMGVLSGFLFFENTDPFKLIVASVLFVGAGVFDSADGQLARIAGRSTKFGLVLDGICDNLVFAAAYIGSTLTIIPYYGNWFWVVAVFAGVCHSIQSSTLDFYNREYLVFGAGLHSNGYWNPDLNEAKQAIANARSWDEWFSWRFRYSWLWQQSKLTTRTLEFRLKLLEAVRGPRSKEMQALYKKHQHPVLILWRPLGANIHTIMILLFAFLRRFDLYLVLIDIFLLTAWLFFVRFLQKKADQHMAREAGATGIPLTQ